MHIGTTTISPETFLAILTAAALVGTLASLAGRPLQRAVLCWATSLIIAYATAGALRWPGSPCRFCTRAQRSRLLRSSS
jgi:hypothetical protein